MIRPVTSAEIDIAIKDMPTDKAPGIDGFPIEFFTRNWDLVKNDIYAAVQSFFETGKLQKKLNCTAITLIPKVNSPSLVKDCRPIACCNTLYKIIAKMLQLRIKKVIGNIVSHSQSAFIEGRSIIDNILFSHELFKGYNRKGVSPRFIEWIMECVNCFILSCAKWRPNQTLSRTKRHQTRGPYVPLPLWQTLNQSGCFKGYFRSSMQLLYQANKDKSSIYMAGVDADEKQAILNTLGFEEGTLPFRYLGVPLSSKKLTLQQCWPLIEKITDRVRCWSARLLSYSGRLQLIKSVLFDIQTYWAQIFLLPKKVMKMIDAVCRTFLWTGEATITKKALIAWEQICRPISAGGLNIINLCIWNKAAVMKQSWTALSENPLKSIILQTNIHPRFKFTLWSIKGWSEELTWASRMARKKTGKAAITSYVFAMLIYSIWRERDMIRFQQSVFEKHRICREIVLHVHTRGRGQPKWQQTLHIYF
uniref:Uncharacterized protein LOC104221414 n=1 Tax=Nicotiana sylvestris TaxID=4096 RepID=A0A1U7VSB7_NICSY|nr:PREDICTED: uncharacterized protein LOC104221414 [Nicotiana sylvestris]